MNSFVKKIVTVAATAALTLSSAAALNYLNENHVYTEVIADGSI